MIGCDASGGVARSRGRLQYGKEIHVPNSRLALYSFYVCVAPAQLKTNTFQFLRKNFIILLHGLGSPMKKTGRKINFIECVFVLLLLRENELNTKELPMT